MTEEKNQGDETLSRYLKARDEFDNPPACCDRPAIVATSATTYGTPVEPVKVCQTCGAWRLSFHVAWVPAEPLAGAVYPDGGGFLIPLAPAAEETSLGTEDADEETQVIEDGRRRAGQRETLLPPASAEDDAPTDAPPPSEGLGDEGDQPTDASAPSQPAAE